MLNKIIDLGFKLSGMSWVWGKVDGYKTKIAAAIAILTGLVGILSQLMGVLDQHSASSLLEFAKKLPTDQSWLMLVGGLGMLGIGHKLSKQVEQKK